MASTISSSSSWRVHSGATARFVANSAADWSLLLSPRTWWQCLRLVLFRTVWPSRTWQILHWLSLIALAGLIAGWCKLFYLLAFETAQYLPLLSSFASDAANGGAAAQQAFDNYASQFHEAVRHTAGILVGLSLLYGCILAMGSIVAAMWRQGIYDAFHRQFFSSDEQAAAILWHSNGGTSTELGNDDRSLLYGPHGEPLTLVELPIRLSQELHLFTSHLSATIFGSQFYYGIGEMFPMIIIFAAYVSNHANDGGTGIGLSLGAFGVCVLLLAVVSLFYARLSRYVLYFQANVHRLVQQLFDYSESIAFFGSEHNVEWPRLKALLEGQSYWMMLASPVYGLLNLPIGLLGVMGGVITPQAANDYVGLISFYGYFFNQLTYILYNAESVMIALNLGHRLEATFQRLMAISDAWHELGEKERRLKFRVPTQVNKEFEAFHVAHVDISIPGRGSGGVPLQVIAHDLTLPVLQSGESLLLYGPSGCGKTTLFRMLAGLLPVDATRAQYWLNNIRKESSSDSPSSASEEHELLPVEKNEVLTAKGPNHPLVSLPELNVVCIPQKPYFSLGSLRLDHLVTRCSFDRTYLWEHVLSMGEQQKLTFLRLLAPYEFGVPPTPPNLLLLDESTSALDLTSEENLYRRLKQHGCWYLSISHRPSLRAWHDKVHSLLQAGSLGNQDSAVEMQQHIKYEATNESPGTSFGSKEGTIFKSAIASSKSPPTSVSASVSSVVDDTVPKYGITSSPDATPPSPSNAFSKLIGQVWLSIRSLWDLLQILRVPFEPNSAGMRLRMLTYAAWLAALTCVFLHAYYTYQLSITTYTLFSVLGDYASGSITIDDAKSTISSQSGPVIQLNIGTLIAYCAIMGVGQLIAALYTQRITVYYGERLLAADHRLYRINGLEGESMSHDSEIVSRSPPVQLPAILSADIHGVCSNLCFILFGSIYYGGLLTIIAQLIALSRLLGAQPEGHSALGFIYLLLFLLCIGVTIVIFPYLHWQRHFHFLFERFAWLQRRVELLAEQIALSSSHVRLREANTLHESFVASVNAQFPLAISYGVFCTVTYFSFQILMTLPYVLPAAMLFSFASTDDRTANVANSLNGVSVFISTMIGYCSLLVFGLPQPWSQLCVSSSRLLDILRLIEQPDDRANKSRKTDYHDDNGNSLIPRSTGLQTHLPVFVSELNSGGITFRLEHLDLCDQYEELNQRVLVRDMSITLPAHVSLLVCGPSGSGKSQLLRILAGIVTPQGEKTVKIERQPLSSFVFLPQRLYLPRASLREVVNYFNRVRMLPDITDLSLVLRQVGLGSLLDRFDPDTLVDWSQTLSGGEQQRICLAAAFVCRSVQCIVLDETTAACDLPVEHEIYQILAQSGKQYISVSHRPEVRAFHQWVLELRPVDKSYELIDQSFCRHKPSGRRVH